MNTFLVLCTIEEDNYITYYLIKKEYEHILTKISNQTFIFNNSRIYWQNKNTLVDQETSNFLSKIRYGRYSKAWEDLGRFFKSIPLSEDNTWIDDVCIANRYQVYFKR